MCNRVGIAYIYAHARTLSHTNTHNTHTHTPKAFPAEIGAHTSLCKLLDHQTRQEENT